MKYKLSEIFEKPISGEWGNELEEGKYGAKVIRTTNFTNMGRLNLNYIVERDIDVEKYENKLLKLGDIIIEKSGGSPNQPVGRVVIFEENTSEKYFCNNFTSILRPKNIINAKYSLYLLKDLYNKKRVLKYQNKTTGIINLKLNDYLNNTEIMIPSIEEQVKISTILDRSQELIDKRKEQIEALDELVKSQFIEMFGDVKKNNKQWETQKGSDLFVFSSGKGKPTANLSDENEYRCYGGNGITGYSDEYLIDYDTLVVGRVGVYCGSIHRTIGKVWITDNAIYIKEFKKNLNLMYLEYLFINMNFNQYADYSGQPKITQKPLQNSLYVLPPIELQNQFADFVKQVDKLKFEMEKSLKELEDNFNSLMQKAFKGELFN